MCPDNLSGVQVVGGWDDFVPRSFQQLILPRHLPGRTHEQNLASQRISNVHKDIVR
jgi:hypothetical protein